MFIRIIKIILAVLVIAVSVVVLGTSPVPYTRIEISNWTVKLNEAAAVGITHNSLLNDSQRSLHSALLVKVETGAALTEQESAKYRAVYQTGLQENQKFLSTFDGELSVLVDYEIKLENNIHTRGIVGAHDHHDLSARRNFNQLSLALKTLENSKGALQFPQRIAAINSTYKNLVDLISHLGVAPHTISVPHQIPNALIGNSQQGVQFEAMLRAYKGAQFELVNSVLYWLQIDEALRHYDALIFDIQNRVVKASSSWERKVAGRFMSLQTFAPPINKTPKLRR